MESRAKVFGHPIHQMLIVFPLGLLGTAVIFDIVHLFTNGAAHAVVAYWMLAAGLLGGLAAAPFGWIDWFAIPRSTRAKRIGLIHGVANMTAVVVFAGSWLLRMNDPETPGPIALILSFAGLALALFGGWLGGELVCRLGIGVSEGAHVNAPNSLSGRPAHEHTADHSA